MGLLESFDFLYLDILTSSDLVQSLNSPFFPPPLGAEPRQAKRESRITCMHMLRIPPLLPPDRGKNIWKYFPGSARGTIFRVIIYKQQFFHSDWSNIQIPRNHFIGPLGSLKINQHLIK